ncbi:MAG: 50S ribosomal protein L11 methyltransferase [Chloroflexota bacterium]|nr:MAG: 50S ribosomal protein L11 methyltransferase [Chloroflexota bacterium]
MTDPAWLEISLTVDGEYAEAVADVLSRFVPGGVVIESTAIAPDPEGEGYPTGPLQVRAFLPVDEHLEETRRRIEESLWYLGRIWPENPLPAAQFTPLQEVNWVETWKQHYKPIPTGKRLVIMPAWLEEPQAGPLAGRVPIRLEPGMAFGTGAHPTTQLCLELIEDYLRDSVIDVGCGSGILSIAALKLGAAHALGVDIDSQAIPIALQNATLNEVAGRLELGVGSVAEIRSGAFSRLHAPLVLANILAPVIIRLLHEGLADLVTPGGVLVLSGILADQWEGLDGHPSVLRALDDHQIRVLDIRRQDDWMAACVEPGSGRGEAG